MDHGTLPVTKRGYRVEQHAVGHGRAGAARQRPGDHHAAEAVDHGIVTTADGSDTMISVRDITDNDGADTLSAGGSEPGSDDSGDSGEQPGGQSGVDDDYGHGGGQTADTGAAVIAVAVAATVAAAMGVILFVVVRRRRKEA